MKLTLPTTMQFWPVKKDVAMRAGDRQSPVGIGWLWTTIIVLAMYVLLCALFSAGVATGF